MTRDARHTVSGEEPKTPHASTPTDEVRPDGQKADHWVLSEEDRKADRVRPIRLTYIHTVCGGVTTMPRACAETYAVDPYYYGSTFCCHCRDYFPVGETGNFLWDDGSGEKVGT